MFWNHRVIEVEDEDGTKCYGIHEVYYDNDGNPMAYTEDAVGIVWEEGDNPLQVIEWMANCLNKPFLKKSDFPEAPPLDWEGDGEEGITLSSPEEIEKFFRDWKPAEGD